MVPKPRPLRREATGGSDTATAVTGPLVLIGNTVYYSLKAVSLDRLVLAGPMRVGVVCARVRVAPVSDAIAAAGCFLAGCARACSRDCAAFFFFFSCYSAAVFVVFGVDRSSCIS